MFDSDDSETLTWDAYGSHVPSDYFQASNTGERSLLLGGSSLGCFRPLIAFLDNACAQYAIVILPLDMLDEGFTRRCLPLQCS